MDLMHLSLLSLFGGGLVLTWVDVGDLKCLKNPVLFIKIASSAPKICQLKSNLLLDYLSHFRNTVVVLYSVSTLATSSIVKIKYY